MTVSELRAAIADYPDYWPIEAILSGNTRAEVTYVQGGKTGTVNVVRVYVDADEEGNPDVRNR